MNRFLQMTIVFVWLMRACYTPYEVSNFIGTLSAHSADTAKVLSHPSGKEYDYSKPSYTVVYQQ